VGLVLRLRHVDGSSALKKQRQRTSAPLRRAQPGVAAGGALGNDGHIEMLGGLAERSAALNWLPLPCLHRRSLSSAKIARCHVQLTIMLIRTSSTHTHNGEVGGKAV